MLTAREHMAYAIGVTKYDNIESRTVSIRLLAEVLKFPQDKINSLVDEINNASDQVVEVLKTFESEKK